MIGQLIDGRYQVTRLLGEGGMGAVYEATHTGTGRRVAVKVIINGELAQNQQMVQRFQREARAAGSIDTQHIVQVLDTGTDPQRGLPFMVMEFLAGEDVQQIVQRLGALPPEIVMRIGAQACIGLQKAHDAGVVHRDIKPANLYLARRDAGEVIVKVLDFGIAKIRMDSLSSSEDQGLTKTGSMLGSPLYMSPEQAKGLKTIDHRTDLWSLGAVLYEALTGRTPHHDVDTLGQLILAICSEQPPPVQDYAPWVPPEVAAVVHGALTLDVNERFQSAQQMFEAIKALLPQGWGLHQDMLVPMAVERRATVAPRLTTTVGGARLKSSTVGGVSASTSHGTTQQGLATTGARPASSKAAPIAIGAVAVLALGGFGAWKLLHASPTHADVQPPAPLVAAVPAPPPAESTPVAAPAATPAPAALPANARKVQVAIVPSSASVEVDGQPATVSGGAVEVAGTLGSVHAVRIFVGARETVGEVVVTEAGAIPPKITLGVAPAKPPKSVVEAAAAAGAAAAAAGGGAPAAGKPAAPKPPAPGLDKKFE